MDTTNRTRNTVERMLNDLGNTSEDVANRLRELGIKGRPGSAFHCPIARYLKTEFSWATVSPGVIRINFIDMKPMPEHVRQFIRDFDSDLYPDLIETEPES